MHKKQFLATAIGNEKLRGCGAEPRFSGTPFPPLPDFLCKTTKIIKTTE